MKIKQYCLRLKKIFLAHNNVPNNFLSGLLKNLNRHPCFSNFPVDSRTLLKTKTPLISSDCIVELKPGHYCHFGLRKGISLGYKEILGKVDKIQLVIGIDGLPITKSSNSCFWPILGYVYPHKANIFIIGIYYGHDKPESSNSYLYQFVQEAIELEEHGYAHENKNIPFSIKAFCVDAPAKSFILNIRGHTGFFSCTK